MIRVKNSKKWFLTKICKRRLNPFAYEAIESSVDGFFFDELPAIEKENSMILITKESHILDTN